MNLFVYRIKNHKINTGELIARVGKRSELNNKE